MNNSDISFTVVIPALNEAQLIQRTIRAIKHINPEAQIIVADGGSNDATVAISRKEGAQVILAQPGRGIQCNAGVTEATGSVLLFLHADTLLPPNAFELITYWFTTRNAKVGTFRLAFDANKALLRFYSAFTKFDSIFTRFGDQCIVIQRSFFMALGGFPDWPLFEDVQLLRIARQKAKIVSFPAAVVTSARRFRKMGLIRTQLLNGLLLFLYLFGVPPVLLANWYTGNHQETARNRRGPVCIEDRRRLACIFLIISLASSVAASGSEQHPLLTSLLAKNVKTGKVNYKELCKDPRLEQYITKLKSTAPDQLSNQKERLSFWINAYNAYTLKVICDKYPVKSINDLHSGGLIIGSVFNTTIWDKKIAIINNKATTLNNIEHKIIRPVFKDPRIHFALVCAAKSCPPLRAEAFESDKLDKQLNEQGRIFLSETSKNRFDRANKKAHISKIFDWYKKDFGEDDQKVLIYLSRFLPDDVRKSIQSAPDQWKVDHTDYDWSLNE